MAVGPDEGGLFAKGIDYLLAGIGALIAALFGNNERRMSAHAKRLSELQVKLDDKADKEEMTRQRDNVTDLYRSLALHRQETATAFSDVKDQIHNMHIDILSKLK